MPKVLALQKLSKKLNFKGFGGELEAKSCFPRQSFTKYLRQSLAIM